MSFEVYDRVYDHSGNHRAQVSIQKAGRMALNYQAFKVLGEPDAVQLLYDRTEKKVGIKSCSLEDEAAFKITKPGEYHSQSRAASWAANGFLRYYKIPHSKACRYNARYEGGVLVISLNGAS